MEYLTTHDIVWINTTITGVTEPYNYVTLEAAMAGQYSYGESSNIQAQAANLLYCLLHRAPFGSGNVRTALVAALTFLNANGYAIAVSDTEAANLVGQVASHNLSALSAIETLCTPSNQDLSSVSLRKLITHECNAHREALQLLARSD